MDRGVRNNVGNGEAKKLICTNHGHELRGWGGYWWKGVCRQRGIKRKNETTITA